jgi:hypothetical protein
LLSNQATFTFIRHTTLIHLHPATQANIRHLSCHTPNIRGGLVERRHAVERYFERATADIGRGGIGEHRHVPPKSFNRMRNKLATDHKAGTEAGIPAGSLNLDVLRKGIVVCCTIVFSVPFCLPFFCTLHRLFKFATYMCTPHVHSTKVWFVAFAQHHHELVGEWHRECCWSCTPSTNRRTWSLGGLAQSETAPHQRGVWVQLQQAFGTICRVKNYFASAEAANESRGLRFILCNVLLETGVTFVELDYDAAIASTQRANPGLNHDIAAAGERSVTFAQTLQSHTLWVVPSATEAL